MMRRTISISVLILLFLFLAAPAEAAVNVAFYATGYTSGGGAGMYGPVNLNDGVKEPAIFFCLVDADSPDKSVKE